MSSSSSSAPSSSASTRRPLEDEDDDDTAARLASAAAAAVEGSCVGAGPVRDGDASSSCHGLLDSADEVRRLVALLEALHGVDDATYGSARFRGVRRALEPLHRRFAARQAAILDSARKKQLERERESRRKRQEHQDRKHRDTTQLRLGRINRLKALCEGAGHGGDDREGNVGALLGDGDGPPVKYLSQVPDGAVKDAHHALPSSTAAAALPAPGAAAGDEENVANGGGEDVSQLHKARQCYTCKARFTVLHHFYASLCPNCAGLTTRFSFRDSSVRAAPSSPGPYDRRHFSANLTGRIALLTGARVKIGYEIGLKLLRAGATLVATTRFPADAAKRYAAEPDFASWRHRLHIHAVDLRDISALEGFCEFLKGTLPRLDVIVNNACQTVRRPASYYSHLLPAERRIEAALRAKRVRDVDSASGDETDGRNDDSTAAMLPLLAQHEGWARTRRSQGGGARQLAARGMGGTDGDALGGGVDKGCVDDDGEFYPTAAELSQLKLAPEDHSTGVTPGVNGELPEGRLDVNGQQIDLRTHNSWLLKLEDVSVPELVEVMAINTLAPFLLNSRLQPLLAATAKAGAPTDGATAGDGPAAPGAAFIVNVSAMEGKFYRYKTPNHPHTNMAKAALNMMTRTSAGELAERDRVYMTAVDTGWINDENPRDRAARTAEVHHFQTPIDEVDAAARVLHPVFHGVATGKPLFGVFLKDFVSTEW